ncbi:NUDIX hydrolase [Nonomuraea aurantiaca]|uniref:NUDIX hydrolase n=1 Tax=Nonomuraea aurantiaca TaxID=2878562 RepID=UPI001CDA1E5D|nr:NUDIX domain-containing protein [Nonomuraea aurantiaca]MCA2226485.1 NUDIX domain-containing protein [Nonomuraea aurantiaca]
MRDDDGVAHDGDAGVPGSLAVVLGDVAAERAAQDAKWGMQAVPDGTGAEGAVAEADRARQETEEAARRGELTWRHILREEVLEAFAESDPEALRAELIQVAAVAVKWAQALDRRPEDTAKPHETVPEAVGETDAKTAEAVGEARPERFRAIVDVHVMLVRDGTVLLGKRAGTGYGDGQWHLPSGHLEPGESVVGAAVREAREEVGVTIRPEDLEFVHVMHRAPDRVGLFFVVRKWAGEPYNAEPHKCAALAWRPLGRLPDDTIGYPAAAIARVLEEEPFALYGWPAER